MEERGKKQINAQHKLFTTKMDEEQNATTCKTVNYLPW
jgi:hypothetical protein